MGFAESCVAGTRIRELAAKHGICTSLVYRSGRERAVAITSLRRATGFIGRYVMTKLLAHGHLACLAFRSTASTTRRFSNCGTVHIHMNRMSRAAS